MTLGEIIQSIREEKDMSQKELAQKINISYSVMNRIESGERPARDEELKKIADVLEVSTDYLLGRTDKKAPSDKIESALENDKELSNFWRTMKKRPELKLMFKQTKDLSPKAIQQVIRIIKAIEDEEDKLN